MGRRHHFRSGELGVGQHLVERDFGKIRKKQEQTSYFGSEAPLGEVELPGIGGIRGIGSSGGEALVISASRKSGESLLLENRRDGTRTELCPTLEQGIPDIVDRSILFAEGDDLLTHLFFEWRRLSLLGLRLEELSVGILAELMAQDAKAPSGIAEALGSFCGGDFIDEEGAESLILSMSWVGGNEEGVGEVC